MLERNYFNKFTDLKIPRSYDYPDKYRQYNKAREEDKILETKITHLLSQIYRTSNNKKQTLQSLSSFFRECEKNGETRAIIGQQVKYSNIALSKVVAALKNEKREVQEL